jgi:hypothetical protein
MNLDVIQNSEVKNMSNVIIIRKATRTPDKCQDGIRCHGGVLIIYDWSFSVFRPTQNFSRKWRRHHYRRRAEIFRPMLGAQGLWAGRDLYRAVPAVTRDLGFSGLIRRTAPFSRLLQHTRGCGRSIPIRILTGSYGGVSILWMSIEYSNQSDVHYLR